MHRYNIFTTWNNKMVIQKLYDGILLKRWDLLELQMTLVQQIRITDDTDL